MPRRKFKEIVERNEPRRKEIDTVESSEIQGPNSRHRRKPRKARRRTTKKGAHKPKTSKQSGESDKTTKKKNTTR